MKRKLFLYFIILHLFSLLDAQEKPCVPYKHVGLSTGPHPEISPIFPGCENFKENNDSLNRCFGYNLSSRIADKLDSKLNFDTKVDSTKEYTLRTTILIHIDSFGKLKMNLKKRNYIDLENLLVTKLKELEEEITGIRPAEYEGGYCSSFRYQLPLLFTEEK